MTLSYANKKSAVRFVNAMLARLEPGSALITTITLSKSGGYFVHTAIAESWEDFEEQPELDFSGRLPNT